jgi:glycine/D-amino acid oxidase-like deaminating enzyme
MPQSFDYLIVGQGLAGSILAYELLKTGANLTIIDNSDGESASKVAAGIFNPITGKRFVKTWLCDEIYNTIIPFYSQLELELNTQFLYQNQIVRPISNIKEQNQLISLANEPENEKYIEFKTNISEISSITNINYGLISTKIGGWIDVPTMLISMKNLFQKNTNYIDQIFDYQLIEFKNDGIFYKENKFKKIIFCEGNGALQNPYFNWLPFNTVKGEILNITMDSPLKNYILLQGIYIVPTINDQYKVGATYNWVDKNTEITYDGRNELELKLKKLLKNNYQTISQHAGIRPATIDRRPFIGLHPKHRCISIFNGLGTKGVSLAPYFAKDFTNFLINGTQLNSDVNINRFSSLYLSSDF